MSERLVVRRDVPPEIPDDIGDRRLPKARGVVTLPKWVNWSDPDPTYDLDDREQRARVCEQVLREGTADDVRHFIDVEELIALLDELYLPAAVSTAWIAWLHEHRGVTLIDCRDRARRERS